MVKPKKQKSSNKSVPETWITGRDAVNQTRTLFEHHGCPFTEIQGDFGKDALVELSSGTDRVLGHSVVLQIKGGRSFQRSTGRYFIPVGSHEAYWRASNVPLLGIVHDPTTNELFWCNISKYLHDKEGVGSIPLTKADILTGATLETKLKPAIAAMLGKNGASWFLSGEARLLTTLRTVCEASDADKQLNAVVDCLALCRRRPSVLIILRHLISRLRKQPLRLALQLLAAATVVESGGIYSEELNRVISFSSDWLTQDCRNQIEIHLDWTVAEIKLLLAATDPEDWHPTGFAFIVWLLLSTEGNQEPGHHKLERAALEFMLDGDDRLAGTAIELALEQYVELGAQELTRMVTVCPGIAELPVYPDLLDQLEHHGEVTVFSG